MFLVLLMCFCHVELQDFLKNINDQFIVYLLFRMFTKVKAKAQTCKTKGFEVIVQMEMEIF